MPGCLARPTRLVERRVPVSRRFFRRVPGSLAGIARALSASREIFARAAAAGCGCPSCRAKARCVGFATAARRGGACTGSRCWPAGSAARAATGGASSAAGTAAGFCAARNRGLTRTLGAGTCDGADRGRGDACAVSRGAAIDSGRRGDFRGVCPKCCGGRYAQGPRGTGSRSGVALRVSGRCLRNQAHGGVQGGVVPGRLSRVSRLGRTEVSEVEVRVIFFRFCANSRR